MNADQLKNFMTKHKMTSSQVADLIGLTPMAVEHWLVGRRSMAKPYGRLIRLFDKHPSLMKEFN